jgi:hypothetical protein
LNSLCSFFTIWIVRESRRLGQRECTWVLLRCERNTFVFGAPLILHLQKRRQMEP